MKYKTSELEGVSLDAAVALADGRLVTMDEPRWEKGEYRRLRKEYGGRHVVRWFAREGENADGPETKEVGGWEPIDNWGSPSTDWAMGGPIIERERISLEFVNERDWGAFLTTKGFVSFHAATPLVAAMRAFVASKLGDEVEL